MRSIHRPALAMFAAAAAAALAVLVAAPLRAADAPDDPSLTRMLRYPTVSKTEIAFAYAGDLWIVPLAGGEAHWLTSGSGVEAFPHFSPDGRWVAFTGTMGGTPQVYVIPATGGMARQLTFHNDVGAMPPRGGLDNQVLGWTPDGTKVLFTAHRVPWSERIGRPYLVPLAGGMEEPLPLAKGSGGGFSPDGKRYVFTPDMREFRTWKRYHGGNAQDVWIYDLAANRSERVTDYDGTDNQPMWVGDTIYFTSDRGAQQKLELWAYDVATKAMRQVTHFDDWDVLWPSANGGSIVYENGGWIWRYDVAAGTNQKVPIRVVGDLPKTLPYYKNVVEDIQSADLSPSGKRALFEARGDIFTVPAKEGEIRNLTATPGIREMSPAWSPDGVWVAYLSDRSGEYEIYVERSDGSGGERRITTGGDTWRYPPIWSPDSKKLAFSDKQEVLRWIDVATGRITDVDHATISDLTDYRWSPDSRWIAYSKETEQTKLSAIWVYSLEQGKTFQLTSGWASDGNPVFDPEGRYLYFLSNRDFHLTFSGFEFNYVYTHPTRVYVGVLAANGPALFLPKSDEEEMKLADDALTSPPKPPKGGKGMAVKPRNKGAATAKETEGPEAETAAAAPKKVTIDVEGFEARVRALPGKPDDYRALAANAKGVFFLSGEGRTAALRFYDLEEQKESTVLDGVDNYALSEDGSHLLFHHDKDYGIVEAKPGQDGAKGLLHLDDLQLRVVPRAEWAEEFVDAWRTLRDWYYDPGMNGVDWNAIRERYGELVPYVADRDDLDDIFGEIAGEISSGHVYVSPSPDEIPGTPGRRENGLLGAEVVADPSGYFRIAHIFPGENWHDDFRSPLTEPGIDVHEGDLILAVDGSSTKGVDNFYRLLENKPDRVVTLTVNRVPETQGAHDERVKTIHNEQNLRYLDWLVSRRAYVDQASGGRIGYIQLPNTAIEGNRELFKGFYPQSTKEALVLDDRYNGGGFIPDRMIELLDRPLLNYWVRRNLDPVSTPGFVNPGPKVCLINGQAGSGGDAFPYYFREVGLGPLIGTKTWGGLIGLSGSPSLMDGGSISTPSFRFLSKDGHWAVEAEGVKPDIEVIDTPDALAAGRDPVLERAVAYLMDQLAKHPPQKLVVPPAPGSTPGAKGASSR